MIFFKKNKDPLSNYIKLTFGITPKQIALYYKALTHKSISKDSNNERLEFLGDKVLSSVVANYLFHNYPTKSEGELTKLSSKMVSRKTLNTVGEQIGLINHIKYIEHQNGHKNLLGNTLEAIIGAIALDYSYQKAEKVIVDILLKKYILAEELDKVDSDYKSQLVIYAQRNQVNIVFNVIDLDEQNAFRATVLIDDSEVATAKAYTKKQAEQKASKKALQKLTQK